MSPLLRATSGFHKHNFRAELRPNRPTHAASPGDRFALCGASVEHIFVQRWAGGPEIHGCQACKAEHVLVDTSVPLAVTLTAYLARRLQMSMG